MWGAIDVAGSGINVDQTWIDTIGGNVANMNDAVTPGQPVYQAQYLDVQAVPEPGATLTSAPGDGVAVKGVELGPATGSLAYEPTNPLADAAGEVEYPVVDLGGEMTDLIESQTSYQANAAVLSKANDAYQSILNIKV
jgi:flagellar basal-body rod protein FlgC